MEPKTCPTCEGTTWEHEECEACNKTGKITDAASGEQKDCPECYGKGIKHYRCTECDGKGYID